MKIALIVKTGEGIEASDAAQLFGELHVAGSGGADISGSLGDGAIVVAEEICLLVSQDQGAHHFAQRDQRGAQLRSRIREAGGPIGASSEVVSDG